MVIKEITNQKCKYLIQTPPGCDLPATLSPATALGVRALHRQLPDYRLTPRVRFAHLARVWGFKDLLVKSEAFRFGLKAFKVLGGDAAVEAGESGAVGIGLIELLWSSFQFIRVGG